MTSKTFQIHNIADGSKLASLILLLFAVNGVSSVDFEPGPNHVKVVFDEESTSPTEITTILEHSGNPVAA